MSREVSEYRAGASIVVNDLKIIPVFRIELKATYKAGLSLGGGMAFPVAAVVISATGTEVLLTGIGDITGEEALRIAGLS